MAQRSYELIHGGTISSKAKKNKIGEKKEIAFFPRNYPDQMKTINLVR